MSFLDKPISELLWKGNFNSIIEGSQFTGSLMDDAEIICAEEDIRKRLACKLKSGICSNVLIKQLAIHILNGYEKYGNEFQHYHVPSILDTIEANECGYTVNIRPFKNAPLKGLHHIHHNSSTFIAVNIRNYWLSMVGNKDEVIFQNELLKETYSNLLKVLTPEEAERKCISVMLNKIHDQTIFRKAKKRTGEWLITYKHIGMTYYLCLATHAEGDNVVWDRVQMCFKQYPELINYLSPNT